MKNIEEKIRQHDVKIGHINWNMSNQIIRDVLLQLKEEGECLSLSDIKANKSHYIDLYKKHDLYKSLVSDGKDFSDFRIELLLDNFWIDVTIYSYETMFKNCLGDLHCTTGNDGDLQYEFICSTCGTLINDDHSAEYQYNRPTLLCPVCNSFGKEGEKRYPFRYRKRGNTDWGGAAHFYSMHVKKILLNKDELREVITELDYVKRASGLTKLWRKFKCYRFFYSEIRKPFIPYNYIAGTDMSHVELKYLNK